MKKHSLLILMFVFLLILIPACKQEPAPSEDENNASEDSSPADPESPPAQALAGPCDNILYPLNPGNDWTYATEIVGEDGQPETSQYSWSVSESTSSSVTLGTLFKESGVVLNAEVICKDGAIVDFPMSQLNMVFGDVEGDIVYAFKSGTFMPSEQEFEAQDWTNTWDTNVEASGVITANFEGESMTINLASSPISMNWEVIGTGQGVEVPAGSFTNAVLVNQDLTFDINSLSITMEGQSFDIATTIKINSDMWFEPHVGLLRTEVKSMTMDLFGSAFPIDPMGYTELISSNLIE